MSSAYVIDETAQARRELASGQFAGHQNAEDLIRSHFASIPPEVRSGLRLAENADARLAALDDHVYEQIEVPEGGTLIDWTVRGNDARRQVLSYVWEDSQGRWHHGVQGYSKDYRAPDESPADRAMREAMISDHKAKTAGAEFNADMEEKLAEHRRELEADLSAKFQALKEDFIAEVQKAAKTDKTGGGGTTSGSESLHNESGKSGGPAVGDDSGDGDVKWPRTHEGIDVIAKDSKVELPEDWDDLKTDAKVEYLESKGVKPTEAQG